MTRDSATDTTIDVQFLGRNVEDASDGDVLTYDGSSYAQWQAPSGGSSSPIQNYFGFGDGVTVPSGAPAQVYLPWGTPPAGTQLFDFAGHPTHAVATMDGLYTITVEIWLDPGTSIAAGVAQSVLYVDFLGLSDGPGMRMPLGPTSGSASALIWPLTVSALLTAGMEVVIGVDHNAGVDRVFYSWVLATAVPT